MSPTRHAPTHRTPTRTRTRTRPTLVLLGLLAVLALLSAGCGGTDTANATLASSGTVAGVDVSGVTLRVGIFQDVTRAQIEATDFLDDLPYQVEWARLNGAGPTMQALGGGAIDISWGLSDTAAPKAEAEAKEAWTAESAPFKIVALIKPFEIEKNPSGVIAAHKDSGINTLADLRGKTYAFNEGGNANAMALLGLLKAGLKPEDVQIRLLQSDSLASAVISGQVQAAASSVSQLSDALASGEVRIVATAAETGFPGYVSVTARSGALADAKLSAAIGDFLTRISRYEKWGTTHTDEQAKAYVAAQQLKQDQAVLAARSTARTLIPVDPSGPGVKVEKELVDSLVTATFLKKPVDVSVLFDDRYTAQIEAGNR